VTDVLQEPAVKQYVRTVAGAMAFVGAGIGVMVVLLGAFGSAPNTAGLSGQMSSQQYKLGLVNTAIGVAPYVALAVAGARASSSASTSRRRRGRPSSRRPRACSSAPSSWSSSRTFWRSPRRRA